MTTLAETSVAETDNKIKKNVGSKKILFFVLIATLVLVPVVVIGGLYWFTSQQGKDWLMTSHFDPKNAGFLMSTQDESWAVMTATENFAKMSKAEKLGLATGKSEYVWNLIGKNQGYSKSELEKWFKTTAENYSSYPIKKANLTGNSLLTYRDFSSTKIPEPNIHRAVFQALTSEGGSSLKFILLWVALPIAVVLFILIGTIGLFLSKQIPLFFKIVIVGLLAVMAIEAWFIHLANNKKIIPSGYFNVNIFRNDYVWATGSWRGVNQKIAYPINTAKIDCRREQGTCEEANAELAGNAIMVHTTSWPISSWDEKEITVDDEGQCTTTKMIINFKDKAVTQIRTSKDPLPEDCAVGADGKFITELVNGMDIAFPKKQ